MGFYCFYSLDCELVVLQLKPLVG